MLLEFEESLNEYLAGQLRGPYVPKGRHNVGCVSSLIKILFLEDIACLKLALSSCFRVLPPETLNSSNKVDFTVAIFCSLVFSGLVNTWFNVTLSLLVLLGLNHLGSRRLLT